jgi:hypothetical protein
MASYTTLSDKGLLRGSFTVTIDGYSYRLKTAARPKASLSAFESDENGRPVASSHVKTWEKITGEIMAYNGVQEPSQLYPFSYDSKFWAITSLTLNYATENLRSYSVEITQLAGTAASDFTSSSV